MPGESEKKEQDITTPQGRLERAVSAGGKDCSQTVLDFILVDLEMLDFSAREKYLERLERAGYAFGLQEKSHEKKPRDYSRRQGDMALA